MMKFGWSRCDHWGRMQSFLIFQKSRTRIAHLFQRRNVRWIAVQFPRLLLRMRPQMTLQKFLLKWVSQHSVKTVRDQRMHLCPCVVFRRYSHKRRNWRWKMQLLQRDFLRHLPPTTTPWPCLIPCRRELLLQRYLRMSQSRKGGTKPGSHKWQQL